MHCPYCGHVNSRVLESREDSDNKIRRRRECLNCKHRFTTNERVFPKTEGENVVGHSESKGLKCPHCQTTEHRVLELRGIKNQKVNRRRRECLPLKHRFTTYESFESNPQNTSSSQDISSQSSEKPEYLDISLEIPEGIDPEKIQEIVRQAVLRADAIHRSNGGSGLKVDLAEIFEQVRVGEKR